MDKYLIYGHKTTYQAGRLVVSTLPTRLRRTRRHTLYYNVIYSIHWRDVQWKNVVNNLDMSSLWAPWQNGPYRKQITERHKTRRTPWRNRYLEKVFVCVVRILFFYFLFYLLFLKCIVQEMLRNRLGTVNDFHWETYMWPDVWLLVQMLK